MSTGEFDGDLLDSGGIVRAGYNYFIKNGGKIIATVTLIVAVLVTFANVSLDGYRADNFATTLFAMLIASYLMFFSLEDAGERLGEETEQYKSARARFIRAKEKIKPNDIATLRDFCIRYSREELEYRRTSLITSSGFSLDEYEAYLVGASVKGTARKCFRRAEKMKALVITPDVLLGLERKRFFSELINPEKYKMSWLILQLVPSTICMTFTVSVMLTAKEDLTLNTVLDGLIKLTALPIVGLRGYSEGYSYVKGAKSAWLETKARLLESFCASRGENVTA